MKRACIFVFFFGGGLICRPHLFGVLFLGRTPPTTTKTRGASFCFMPGFWQQIGFAGDIGVLGGTWLEMLSVDHWGFVESLGVM